MSDLILKSVANNEEYHLANDLMAKVFPGNYYKSYTLLGALGDGYPGYTRDHTRIALRNGELAGALRITTDTIRIGEARLHCGGFGWVATHPEHRHKGVARELMGDTVDYLKNHGYHVSMLFGIPNFYHRFGFTSTFGDYLSKISVAELLGSTNPPLSAEVFKGCKVRDCKPGDIPAIQRIHNMNDVDTACSLLRTRMHYTRRWERWQGAQVLTNSSGKVIGYYKPEEFSGKWRIRDIGVADLPACEAMLWHLAQWAHSHFLATLRIVAPPSHPFIRYVSQFKSLHENHLSRNAEGMMAILNLGETLESMIPEWECRLQNSNLFKERLEITLYIDRSPYRVRATRGCIDISAAVAENKFGVSSQEMVQLLTGFRHLEDVMLRKRRILNPLSRQFLAILFPKRSPFVWPFDRF